PPQPSDLDHLEIFLARPAVGAAPGEGHVVPARARGDSGLRITLRFVVGEAADEAHVRLHSWYPSMSRLHDGCAGDTSWMDTTNEDVHVPHLRLHLRR